MKKMTLLLLLLAIILLESCKKGYQYIEFRAYRSATGEIRVIEKDPVIFQARDDTTAFRGAYLRYWFSYSVQKKHPISDRDAIVFMLISPDGRDITDIEFVTKEQKIKYIEENY